VDAAIRAVACAIVEVCVKSPVDRVYSIEVIEEMEVGRLQAAAASFMSILFQDGRGR
jgi:hypothetical protein